MKILEKVQVKHQYSVVQALYWMTSCALAGYAAVYLQDRGLSNTLIGVTVGGAACLSMVIQPLAAQVVESISGLTVKKVIQALIVMMAVMFGVLTVIPVPVAGVVILYMGMNTLNYCMPPMLSAMGMEFINRGYYLNFGLSRGLGSISYAVCAAVLGIVIDRFFPGVLGYIYVVLAILLFLAVSAMKDLEAEEPTFQQEIVEREKKPEESIWKTVCKNKTFLCLMIGFCLANMNNAAIATYTVNIIKNLGGSDTVLGFANFVSAASEMPVMLLFGYFMKKGNCIRLLKVSAVFFLIKPLVLVFANATAVGYSGTGTSGTFFWTVYTSSCILCKQYADPGTESKRAGNFQYDHGRRGYLWGNVLGGWLQDAFGLQTMLWVCAAMALVGVLFVIQGLSEKEKG